MLGHPHPAGQIGRERWRYRWRLILVVVGVTVLWTVLARQTKPPAHPVLTVSLAAALTARGLSAHPANIHLAELPQGSLRNLFTRHRAFALASRQKQPSDVFSLWFRLSPEGSLLELCSVTNLSDTAAAEESHLSVFGERVAFLTQSETGLRSLNIFDFGRPTDAKLPSTRRSRLMLRLEHLEQKGSLHIPLSRSYRFEPEAKQARLAFVGEELWLELDQQRLRLRATESTTPDPRLVSMPLVLAEPGNLVTWSVDRLRQSSWFGNERMQLLKTLSFGVYDRLCQIVLGWRDRDGSRSAAAELEGLTLPRAAAVPLVETGRDGWPPPPLEPLLTPPLPDEGVWRSLADDPFIADPNQALLFAFLRADPERRYSQVFVVLWDPRLIELRTMSGTREPKSATGDTGPGLIPRDPEILERLVGAMNGGFQATHGEYGMAAEGIVYLPPLPYAATVARTRDGSTVFGTWPENTALPPDLIDLRQNLSPLLSDGVVNPYRRSWWGGVPEGWDDATRTVRTGLCLTRRGHVGYFYGGSISHDRLTAAMQRADCDYAMHLDMNPGHTGLEFYRVGPRGSLPVPAQKLDRQWQARGSVPELPSHEFLGRRMIRLMNLMNFPRYIGRESRDFIYLVRRRTLPPSLTWAQSALDWQVLPNDRHNFPPAVTLAHLRPVAEHPSIELRIVAFDAKWLRLASSGSPPAASLVTLPLPSSAPSRGITLEEGRFILRDAEPGKPPPLFPWGEAEQREQSTAGLALLGDDTLVLVELMPGSSPAEGRTVLANVLDGLRAKEKCYLTDRLSLDLTGRAVGPKGRSLIRGQGPSGKRFFPDTPVVGKEQWRPFHARRTRPRPPRPAATPVSDPAPSEETTPPLLP